MLKPILHRLILKLDDVEEVTESGIIISKDLIKKERKAVELATVIAVGDTAFKDYGGDLDTVKIGDRVVIDISIFTSVIAFFIPNLYNIHNSLKHFNFSFCVYQSIL